MPHVLFYAYLYVGKAALKRVETCSEYLDNSLSRNRIVYFFCTVYYYAIYNLVISPEPAKLFSHQFIYAETVKPF